MANARLNRPAEGEAAEVRWKDLYRVGGIVAIVIDVLILLAIVAFVAWPYLPGSTSSQEILTAIQSDPLGSLMALDILVLISNLCGVLLFLALYVSLKQVNESYALIALVLGLLAAVLIVPARPIIELFSLSEGYAAATTDAMRGQYLGAADALLTLFDGTNFILNTLFGGLSLLVSSLLMLRSSRFGKATAYVGILTNAAVCFFFLPVVGAYLLFLSLPGYLVWNIQLARGFFQMVRFPVPAEPAGSRPA
jgi:hypothetical protein